VVDQRRETQFLEGLRDRKLEDIKSDTENDKRS